MRALKVAAPAVDRPGHAAAAVEDIAAELRTPLSGRRRLRCVAEQDGRVVGLLVVRLPDPATCTRGCWTCSCLRRPPARDGTGLLRRAPAVLAGERRRTLTGDTDEGSAGAAFCAAHGLRAAGTGRLSLLRMAEIDWPDVTDRGWSTEFIRDWERECRFRGLQQRVIAAVHEATGEVPAFTEVELWTWTPALSEQADTAVVAAHRGPGLGLCLKAAVLRRLRRSRPDVIGLLTGNAAGNTHMLRINLRLGYRPYVQLIEWRASVPAPAARPGPARPGSAAGR